MNRKQKGSVLYPRAEIVEKSNAVKKGETIALFAVAVRAVLDLLQV